MGGQPAFGVIQMMYLRRPGVWECCDAAELGAELMPVPEVGTLELLFPCVVGMKFVAAHQWVISCSVLPLVFESCRYSRKLMPLFFF